MLSTFTTSKRRRGLRGTARKASREQLPTAVPSPPTPSLYSLSSTSSRASTSSLSSTHTISRMSHATSMTSVSHASTSHCVEESALRVEESVRSADPQDDHLRKQNTYPPPLPHMVGTPLSPIEIFKQRLAEGTHMRKESAPSLPATPVRVVRVAGRGGQGSRPRALPVDLNAPASAPMPLPPREIRRSTSTASGIAQQPTRIVGRGGVGSRPRGLLFSEQQAVPQFATPPLAAPTPPPPPPPRTAAMIQESPRPPVVYRPSGRGGAGSRPRKVKPQSEEKEKEFKFPWKGKGKAKVDLSASGLTRTDTRFSEISSIAFASPASQQHQKPINPDPLMPSNTSFTSIDSWDAHLAQQQSNRINKLARTLGADFSFPGKTNSNGPHGPLDAQAAKLARRSSISVPSTPLDEIASHSSRRQSSYGSLVQHAQNDSASSTHSSDHRREVWDSSEHQPSPYIHGGRNITDSPTQGYYPAPPRPPQAYPDAPEYDDDDDYLEDEDEVSEILSLNQSDDPRFSLNSQSSGEVHVQPPFEIEETDSEYGRAQTPTPFAPYSDSRGETPLPDDKQRFESPFQTMPLFVLPWEPTHRPSGPAADDLANEWSGEWNQKDMQSVIRSLRTLKFSGD